MTVRKTWMHLCFVIHDEERKNRALPTDRRGFSGPPCDRLDHHHRPSVHGEISLPVNLHFLVKSTCQNSHLSMKKDRSDKLEKLID